MAHPNPAPASDFKISLRLSAAANPGPLADESSGGAASMQKNLDAVFGMCNDRQNKLIVHLHPQISLPPPPPAFLGNRQCLSANCGPQSGGGTRNVYRVRRKSRDCRGNRGPLPLSPARHPHLV